MPQVEDDKANLFILIQKKENQFKTRLSVSFSPRLKPTVLPVVITNVSLDDVSGNVTGLAKLNYQRHSDNMAGWQDDWW